MISRIFFLSAIFLAPLYLGGCHLWSFSVSAAFLAASLLCRWSECLKTQAVSWTRSDLYPFFGLYFLVFTISLYHSQIPSRSAEEAYKLLVVCSAFLTTLQFCRDRKSIQRLCGAMALFGGILAFVGLLQYLGGLSNKWWHIRHFLASVYVNHNHFAGLLELLLPVALGLAIAEREKSKKILFIFMCTLMGAAFIFTLSRGGYVALSAALVVMLILLLKRKVFKEFWSLLATILILVGLTAGLFGWGPVEERISTVGKIIGGDVSSVDRLLIWRAARSVIAEHPWFGSGPGTFEFTFLKHRPEGFFGRPVYAHNDYLNLWADCGVLVFAAAILLVALILLKGLKIIHQDDSRLRIAVGSGCIAAIVALSVHAFIDFNFHIPANWMWFAVVSGLLMSLDNNQQPLSPRGDRNFKLASVIFALLVLVCAVFYGTSDFYRWRSAIHRAGSDKMSALADADRSLRINPYNDRVYDLRGRIRAAASDPKAREAAVQDFKEAIRLNPLESYYDYRMAKNDLHLSPSRAGSAIASYRSALAKDPRDPKLHYLIGADLLIANKKHDPSMEAAARRLLAGAVKLQPAYEDRVYASLWRYAGSPKDAKEFEKKVSSQFAGISWFFKKTDRWKDYRKYYLEHIGIDPEHKYRVFASRSWEALPETAYKLAEFAGPAGRRVFNAECIYANGELKKKITIKKNLARIVLRARGSKAGNSFPILLVKLDGKTVDCLYIDSTRYSTYYSVIGTTPGEHELSLQYVNDWMTKNPPADRNVWIEAISIHHPKD